MRILIDLFYKLNEQIKFVEKLKKDTRKEKNIFRKMSIRIKIVRETRALMEMRTYIEKYLEDGTTAKNKKDLSVLADHEKSHYKFTSIIPHLEVII